jgi:hypothetical protein
MFGKVTASQWPSCVADAPPLWARSRFCPLLFCQKPMVAVWPAATVLVAGTTIFRAAAGLEAATRAMRGLTA